VVDANAPDGHYVVTPGTSVYDIKSKLTWQQISPSTTYMWADAKAYCAGLGASLGGVGWRLPTIKELATIVDYSKTPSLVVSQPNPTIDANTFPETPSAFCWSSPPLAGTPSKVWFIAFQNGSAGYSAITSAYVGNVRCVRTGL
jgi:hypothetical protein